MIERFCYTHKNVKQAQNDELVLKKVHRVIKFNQEAWLKPFLDMNAELRKNAKHDLQKYFLG